MADSNLVTQEEMALRRRARRRLVGAVAIALAAVVSLPMLFDPEPKPLGPEVDLRIPAKNSPFAPALPASGTQVDPVAPEPSPRTAEPTQPDPPRRLPAQSQTAQPVPVGSNLDEKKQAESKPIDPSPATDRNLEKPVQKEAAKLNKSETKTDKKTVETVKPAPPKPEIKPLAKADPAFASKGYYLQLGAFSSEINARQLQEKAQVAGFKAGLNSANGQFRVRVGPIVEHDKALEIQAKLKAKGFNPVLLGP